MRENNVDIPIIIFLIKFIFLSWQTKEVWKVQTKPEFHNFKKLLSIIMTVVKLTLGVQNKILTLSKSILDLLS